MKAATHLATVTRNTEKSTKNGEPRSERKIRGAMKWTHIIDTTRNGVESMISAIVWFGIGAICGAMMLVAYSVITFDERKKQERKERSDADKS